MHWRGISRLSRRPDLSTSSASWSIFAYRRTFQSCAVRRNDTGNENSSGGKPIAKFGNRWGNRSTQKSTGLSAAEQTLREALVSKNQPKSAPESPQAPKNGRWRDRSDRDIDGQASGRHSGNTKRRQDRMPSSRRSTSDSQPHQSNTAPGRNWTCNRCNATVHPHLTFCPRCTLNKGRAWPPEERFRKGDVPDRPKHDTARRDGGKEWGMRYNGYWNCPGCKTRVPQWKTACPSCSELRPGQRGSRERFGNERALSDTAKFQELGRSILSEEREHLEKEEEDDLRGAGPSSREQEPDSDGTKSKASTSEQADTEAEKQAKDKTDQWSWDMSALEQLESLEAQKGQTELQKKSKRREGRKSHVAESEEDDFDDELANIREERKRRKQAKAAKKKQAQAAPAPLYLPEFISVSNLADVIGVRPAQFVSRMEDMGFEDVSYDHVLDAETAGLVAAEFNYEAIFDDGTEDLQAAPLPEDTSNLPPRPPVVTIMGHVDHGKTTILDWLRKSSVAATEHGGITQHIGAFSVAMPSGKTITFLDTPGHSAFLEMRRRGADVTDIVVLVVAADDSVKPQTIEAIKHATQANVPIIVAMSKIDKEGSNPDKVKQDLSVHGIHVEDYGGDVQAIPVSGKTGAGMIELEEAIGVLSEMLDHRAEREGNAEGWVIEASTKSYGRVASALIRRGTLRPGDVIVAGTTWARVRTLRNEAGMAISEATPGMPVEIDGWREQPAAGTEILQAESEQNAKDVVEYRLERSETAKMGEDMAAINEARLEKRKFEKAENEAAVAAEPSGPKPVNFIVKADVDGSAEAVLNSIAAIGNNEVYANVLRSGVGPVGEFDVEHAASANGKVISFNMPIDPNMMRMAEREGVQIMDHNIIYKLIDDVKVVLSEQLPPTVTQRVTGEAEVQQVFEITIKNREKTAIAGCRVRNGMINKARKVRVTRGDKTIYDGTITSLKNVKKDVTEMRKDTECGIGFEGWADFAAGDHIQCYEEIFEKRFL